MNEPSDELMAFRRLRRVEQMVVRYAVLLGIVLFIVVVAFARLAALNERLRTMDAVQLRLSTLVQLELDEESAVRGFATTGKAFLLAPYYTAHPRFSQLLAVLIHRSPADPPNGALLGEIAQLHARWEREIVGQVLGRKGSPRAAVLDRTGTAMLDRIRADLGALDRSYGALAESIRAERAKTALLAEISISFLILLIGGIGYVMERRSAARERQLFVSLIESRDLAKRASDWRSKVVAMLAHDFKSTVSAIFAQAQMLEDFPERRDDTRTYAKIQESAAQLARMADEALMMARISNGRLDIGRRELGLDEMIEEVIERYQGERAIVFSATNGSVFGDRDYLLRMLDNLVSNAVKYSPPSSTITITVTQTNIDRVQIAVHDDGAGISAEDLPHIFDEYWRAKSQRNAQGTGVGLYIVKKIVEAHSGEVRVESSARAGTTFYVALPSGPVSSGERLTL